jgi:hypothetical protein
MDNSRAARLVGTALACYPARWRRRHGDEAAELAGLLMRDGIPAGSIACSYLAGAAREWLRPRPGWRLAMVACALLVAASSLGISAGVLAPAPARAASTSGTHARAHCGHGLPEPVPSVIPAADRLRQIIRAAGHGRSCGR